MMKPLSSDLEPFDLDSELDEFLYEYGDSGSGYLSKDGVIEDETWNFGDHDFEFGLENFSSPYPGISCVTPGNPYVLHCFPPFRTELTKEQHKHLDIIAKKIQRSFSTTQPITKVKIVGHSSTWYKTSRSKLEERAFQRAGNAREQLILRLDRRGMAKKVEIGADGRSDRVRWLGKPYSSTSSSQSAQNDRALNRRVEIHLIENKKKKAPKPPPPQPKPKDVILPKAPNVEPRIMRGHEFTRLERAFASKAWKKAVKEVYYARWFIKHMEGQNRTTRIRLWNGTISFPGVYHWGVPKVWFGDYSDAHFANVRDAVDRIWEKFRQSQWKMKRQDCVVWASAHVIVAPQIRLCDNFFGDLSAKSVNIATQILIHEMSHHIWLKSPLRQIKDNHVAPVPPCHGPCYGAGKAQMLADKFPMHAVANPDNYAYFIQSYGSHLP